MVKTVLEGSKINVSIDGTFPAPGRDYIYALDIHASQVLKIKLPIEGNQIGLVAGSADGETGHKDGWGKSSLFNHPKDLTVDDEGNVYVADVRNRVIRKINPDGAVSTIAGQSNVSGFADGEGKRVSLMILVSHRLEPHKLHIFTLMHMWFLHFLETAVLLVKGNLTVCNTFSVGLEGLFFVISETIMISTITVLAWKDAALREKLRGLQLVVANRLTWRHSGDDPYAPLQSNGLPQLPSSAQAARRTSSLPADSAGERLPDLIDLSYETGAPDVPDQTPRITDGVNSTRGRVQDPAVHSEAQPDTPNSLAGSLVSDRDQAEGNQRLSIEEDRS